MKRLTFAILPTLALADRAPAQSYGERIARAEKLLAAGEKEPCARVLRSVAAELPRLSDAKRRRALRSKVRALMRKADPADAARARVVGGLAKDLARLADSYAGKGWITTALELLERVRLLDPSAVGDRIAKVSNKQVRGKPRDPLVAALDGGIEPYNCKGWRATPAHMVAPVPTRDLGATMIVTKKDYEPEHVSVQYRLDGGLGKAALTLGYGKEGRRERYYLLEARHFRAYTDLRIVSYDGSRFSYLAQSFPDLSVRQKKSWLTLRVRAAGGRMSVQLADRRPLSAAVPRPVAGRLGLYVAGNTWNDKPVLFRGLDLEPPRAEEPAAVTPAGRVREVLERGKRDAETTAAELRGARRLLPDVKENAIRAELAGLIDKALRRADSLSGRRARIATKAADALAFQAEAYGSKKWFATAVEMLEHATWFDAARGVRLAEARAKIAADPGAATGVAIHDWFLGGDLVYETDAWRADGQTIVSPPPSGGTSLLLAKRPVGTDIRVSFEYQTGAASGDAGLVFHFANPDRYEGVSLVHDGKKNLLEHFRHIGRATTQNLLSKKLGAGFGTPGEWIAVKVELRGRAGVVQVGDAKPVKLKRLLAATESYLGLIMFGGTTGEAPTRFRKFRVAPLPGGERRD